MELCPDAPGDNDLRPGTWTSRHRSRIVSDRNLAKSNPNNETTATTRLVQCAVTSGADRLRSLADSGESRNFLKLLFVDFKELRDSPLSAKLRSRSAPEVTAHWTSLVVAVVSLLGFDFAKFLSETILER